MNVEEDSKAGHETRGQNLVCRAECLAFRNLVAGGRDSHIHLSVTVGHNACQGKIARAPLLRRASAGLMDRCGGPPPPGRRTGPCQDAVPHDVLSDPPHVHTDCPEFNAAGFIVPGQARSTDPLSRILSCGFHDHLHESDSRFVGKVTVETR